MSYLCTECFINFGVREVARKICSASFLCECKKCGSTEGYRVDRDLAEDIMTKFFVLGSIPPEVGGPAPVFQYNDSKCHETVSFGSELDNDLILLSNYLDVKLFHYGPPLWRLGNTEHYQKLKNMEPFATVKDLKKREEIWDEVVERCKVLYLDENKKIFRLRCGRELVQATPDQFDTPPNEVKTQRGRYDSDELPIFYASDDVEVCIHESRATLADNLTLGTLTPNRPLKVVDLSEGIDDSNATNEFESVTRMLIKMSYSGREDYDLCRELALHIKKKGFDGFLFLSYFSQAHKKNLKNIALFDYPIRNKVLSLDSVNRVILDYVDYGYSFGPHKDQHLPPNPDEFMEIAALLENSEISGLEASERMKAILDRKSKGPR